MENLSEILSEVEQKIFVLAERLQKEMIKNAEREEQIEKLNIKIAEIENKNELLEKENRDLKELKQNKFINKPSEVTEYIKIIDELIEKIDKSIAVVSSKNNDNKLEVNG